MKIRMWKATVGVVSMLIVVLLLISCNTASEEEVRAPSEQEIVSGMLNAFNDISTSQFNMNMTIEMSGEVADTTPEATMVMDFKGALDYESRKIKADITINIMAPNAEENETTMTMYLLDGTAYFLLEAPGGSPTWVKTETSTANWETMNQSGSQLELLEGAQIEVVGSEKIEGIDCYVLQITPDIEKLWQITMQQAGVTGHDIPDIEKESLEEIFDSFSVKQWIAKDTYFLVRAEINMNLEVTPQELGSSSNEQGIVNIVISMDLYMYNYNQRVSIVLPPEAEKAVEVPVNR